MKGTLFFLEVNIRISNIKAFLSFGEIQQKLDSMNLPVQLWESVQQYSVAWWREWYEVVVRLQARVCRWLPLDERTGWVGEGLWLCGAGKENPEVPNNREQFYVCMCLATPHLNTLPSGRSLTSFSVWREVESYLPLEKLRGKSFLSPPPLSASLWAHDPSWAN